MTKKELRKKLLEYYKEHSSNKVSNRVMPYEFIDLYAYCLKVFNWWYCKNSKYYDSSWYCGALEACYHYENEFKEVYNL